MVHSIELTSPPSKPSLARRQTYDNPGSEAIMRSDLIYAAGVQVQNRFLLAATAMRAMRRLHVDATRTEDTINRVFTEIASCSQAIGKLPEIMPSPAIDVLLIAPVA